MVIERRDFMTVEEQLAQVNEAIAAIEIGGQEYQMGPSRLKRADLNTLYQRQKELQALVQNENNNSSLFPATYAAVFDGR